MLSWTQQSDGWYANGFRIVRDAPSRWLLTEPPPEPASDGLINFVAPAVEPLATARTLSEAKREAEICDAARNRARLRRRHSAILLLTVATTILSLGESQLVNATIILAASYFVLRSTGMILGTLLWRIAGNAADVAFYQ